MQSYGCQCWEENVNHFCPAHPKYNPNMKCQDHMECSDPIFRCFDLAKLANEYADKVHEFREECNEIARQCRQLSVQLLEQCVNIEEVQVLLKENAGSSKYFRNTEEMKYPRLKLAIEHNNKEFVGHVFCQQILRQQWHGDLLWQGTPLKFKIVHFLLQVLLAPLFVFSFFVAEIGKDFIEDNTDSSGFTNDVKKITWKHKMTKCDGGFTLDARQMNGQK